MRQTEKKILDVLLDPNRYDYKIRPDGTTAGTGEKKTS